MSIKEVLHNEQKFYKSLADQIEISDIRGEFLHNPQTDSININEPTNFDTDTQNKPFLTKGVTSKSDPFNHNLQKSGLSKNFSYEESKTQYKLGVPSSIIFLVKSCFGIGLFTCCYGFAKVGYVLGAIITILVAYISAYGIWIVGQIANEFEEENKKDGFILNTIHDTGMCCVKKSWRSGIKILIIFSQMFLNMSTPVANTVMMAKFVKDNFDIDTTISKIVIGVIYQIIVIVCAEVEKIKYLATPIFICYIIIAAIVTGDNFYQVATDFKNFIPKSDCEFGNDVNIDMYNLKNFTIYLGIVMYGLGGLSTAFTIRNTMAEPKKLPKVTISAFVILGFLYLLLPLSTYLVYGDQTQHSSFYCYSWSHDKFFYILEIIFVLTLAPFMPFYIISTFEPLEYFEKYKRQMLNNEGNLSRIRVVITRCLGTVLIVGLCMISDNVNTVTEFAGNLVGLIICFAIPIFLVHAKAYWIDKKRKSVFRIIHDFVIFILSIFMTGYGTYKQIYGLITDAKE